MLRLLRVVVVVVAMLAVALAAVAGADNSVQDHIREHMPSFEDPYNDDVFFFTLHDFNSNGHLDGHEIRVALVDSHAHKNEAKTLEQIEKRVDEILARDDKNGDGSLSFGEFRLVQFYSKF